MPLLRNIGQLATCAGAGRQGGSRSIERAALVWRDDRVLWVGPEADLPPEHFSENEVHDAGGRLVIPGLVDCHTHLAFAGWRPDEFERRLRGESYLDIARGGGGILRTVRETRAAPEDELVQRGGGFLDAMMSRGVTTVEAKSGYGLDTSGELKLLRVYRRLGASAPVAVVPTFLGAHAIPPEHGANQTAYVDLVADEMLPRVAAEKLARFCDVFVEQGAFTIEEARRILAAARRLGLGAKLHVDQLRDGGGAALAAEAGAISADHLEHVSARGLAALRDAGVVAVSLPIAAAVLGTPVMPARAALDAGVAVAVATDFNPGSAPSHDLHLALWLACTLQRMTPLEALEGATRIAARALGKADRVGSLEPGKRADFAIVDAESVTMWLYHFRAAPCRAVFAGGRQVRPAN